MFWRRVHLGIGTGKVVGMSKSKTSYIYFPVKVAIRQQGEDPFDTPMWQRIPLKRRMMFWSEDQLSVF